MEMICIAIGSDVESVPVPSEQENLSGSDTEKTSGEWPFSRKRAQSPVVYLELTVLYEE